MDKIIKKISSVKCQKIENGANSIGMTTFNFKIVSEKNLYFDIWVMI